MKYLKEYVDWDSKETGVSDNWALGSYVLVTVENFTKNGKKANNIKEETEMIYGQITKWLDIDEFPFEVTISNGDKMGFADSEIIRYLTKEEIEQYELEVNAKKYNL